MTDYPHVPAAFINAIADEGTKAEAIEYLQKQWNETCALRGRLLKRLVAGDRPRAMLAWAVDMFGQLARLRNERLRRFVEEAIELAHADGMSRQDFDAIADRVYSRKIGSVPQEIGQALVCLETYAESIDLCASDLADDEFDRIRKIPREEWERRQNAKAEVGIAMPIGAV